MRRYLLLILLVAVACVGAAGRYRARLGDFSPGLQTSYGYRTTAPGAAVVAHNLDFTKQYGSFTQRDGYGLVLKVQGIDSFLWNGFVPIAYSNGDRQFLAVCDTNGADYAVVYASGINRLDMGVVDSFLWVADTAANIDTCSTHGYDTYAASLWIWCKGTKWGVSAEVDKEATRAEIVDSLVPLINAAGCNQYVAASDYGDTLVIREIDSTDYGVVVSRPFPNPFDGLWPGLWFNSSRGFSMPVSQVYSRFPAGGDVRWAQYKDNVYITSSVGRGMVFDGRHTQKFPLRSPGEPHAVPLTTAGTLHGEYRYAIRFAAPKGLVSDTIYRAALGALSVPISVDSGQVLLSELSPITLGVAHETDSVTVEIWRTTGDVGTIDARDTIWFTGITIVVDSTNYYTASITDNTSDDSLRLSTTWQHILKDTLSPVDPAQWRPSGTDDSGSLIWWDTWPFHSGEWHVTRPHQPGAPTVLSFDVAVDSGIWHGAEEWEVVAGYSYRVAFVDTSFGITSLLGPELIFFQNVEPDTGYTASCAQCSTQAHYEVGFAKDSTASLEIVLPRTTDSNLMCLLYRSPVRPVEITTKQVLTDVDYGSFSPLSFGGLTWDTRFYSRKFDANEYYLVGLYDPGDTITDELGFDSLLTRAPYMQNWLPGQIYDITVLDDRLALTDGRFVYISEADTNLYFDILEAVPIAQYSGDDITALWPQKGVIKAAKSNTIWQIYKNASGSWSSTELSANYGCVSGLSHAVSPEGDLFLSADGARIETEGLYKDRSYIGTLISHQLSNFRNLDVAALRRSFGAWYDGKYILSVPGVDTSYVAQRLYGPDGQIRYAWSTWDLVMCGGGLFRVGNYSSLVPADSFWFIKPGGTGIYKLGLQDNDNGAAIVWTYESGWLNDLADDGQTFTITDVALAVQSGDTVDQSLYVLFYDDRDSAHTTEALLLDRMDTAGFYLYDYPVGRESTRWRVRITGNGTWAFSSDTTAIEEIRVGLSPAGPVGAK